MAAITLAADLRGPAARTAPRFYVWMAAVCVLIAFGGFIPTYWARLAAGSFHGAPIVHVHGALFFGWTLFLFMQAWLVASGRTLDHRAWGLAGISLATAMVISVLLTVISGLRLADAAGMGDRARHFAYVPLNAGVMFTGFFTAAIVNVKRSEWHKRLILLATVPLMQAATARIFLTLFAPPGTVGPPPVFVSVPPGLLVDSLVVAGIVYDWRTRGRPHPAYLIGGPLLMASQLLAVPLSATAPWMALARWLQSLPG